jgi:ubiquinone/menaquinone biosynthesis C-methylase UbiE
MCEASDGMTKLPENHEPGWHGSEPNRLREVYADYERSPEVLARWSSANPGNRVILAERAHAMRKLLSAHRFWPLEDLRILDVGCGTGRTLAQLRGWGARASNLVGIDLFQDYLDVARTESPDIRFICGNAAAMPFGDGSFDLVIVFTVFSSILDERFARTVASEVARVLRPRAAVLWYDFRMRNPANPNVRGVRRGQLDLLFPGFAKHLLLVTVLPPLARRLGPLAPQLYPALRAVPLLRTHHIGLLIKPPD